MESYHVEITTRIQRATRDPSAIEASEASYCVDPWKIDPRDKHTAKEHNV